MGEERQFTPEDRALFEAEVERLRQQELPRARDEEIKAAAQRAVQRDLEIERENYRDELDQEVAQVSAETVAEERAEARREGPSKIVLLILLLLLLILVLEATTGQLRTLFRGGAGSGDDATVAKGAGLAASFGPTTTPVGGVAGGESAGMSPVFGGGDPNAGAVDAPGSIVPLVANVDPFFWPYYAAHDGLRVFGLPLDAMSIVNGRRVQWFERGRLEEWPENPDPRYQIQPGLVGREYTDGRTFPTQTFFTSRPGLIYVPETSHGLGGLFLDYWNNHGGLDIFGYPISEEIPEVLEDGRIHTVQYFERARMELHRDRPGDDQVMLGLLGSALYKNEPRPEVIPAPHPTPVPLP